MSSGTFGAARRNPATDAVRRALQGGRIIGVGSIADRCHIAFHIRNPEEVMGRGLLLLLLGIPLPIVILLALFWH